MKRVESLLFIIFFCAFFPAIIKAQVISTFAGGGLGDGGAATAGQVYSPQGLATDAGGNVYIADAGDKLIRKVSTSGVLSTVAGNESNGFSGDGGAATAAELNGPSGIAVDASGNIYIADANNNRIRKVNTLGIITTIAGNGSGGYSGDGGPATAAKLNSPTGVAVDAAGNIYIADYYNDRIRKINTMGVIITVAGNGSGGYSGDGGQATSASLSSPQRVAVDADTNIYIADNANNRIRKVNTSGIITTIAGNGTDSYSGDSGPATAAEINSPTDVAVDDTGNVYIADGNQRIRKISTTGIIKTIAGGGSGGLGDGGAATAAEFNNVEGVTVDITGNVYVSDNGNERIRRINASGIINTFAGNGTYGYSGFSGDGGQGINAKLNDPYDVAMDNSGNFYIADYLNERIRKVSTSGIITTIAGNGSAGYSGDGGSATSAEFNEAIGVAVDASGDVFIADAGNNRIRKVNPSGTITTFAGNGTASFSGDGGPASTAEINSPHGIAVDAIGNLYIADAGNSRIREVNIEGTITTIAGNGTAGYSGDGGQATAAKMDNPKGVATDAGGNIYVADNGNERVRKINDSGIIITIAGNGSGAYSGDGGQATSASLSNPQCVAVDAVGNVYISDNGNERIRKVNTSGVITTIAGIGTASYDGDGGPATAALINSPEGSAVDAGGDLYFADEGNDRIRKITPSIPLITGNTTLCLFSSETLSDATSGGTWGSSNTSVASVGSVTGMVSGLAVGTSTISYTVSGITTATTLTVYLVPPTISGSMALCAGSTAILSESLSGGTWSSGNNAVGSISSAGIITGVAAGTVTITYSSGAACFATAAITVNPNPAAILGSNNLCLGSTTLLTDPTGGGTWVSSNPTMASVGSGTGLVSGAAIGTPTITYLLGTGCTATTAVAINSILGISGNHSFCAGSTLNLTDGSAGGTWSSSNPLVASAGTVTGIISGIAGGTASITYSCGGCNTLATVTVNPESAISGSAFVCIGSTISLSDAVSGGTWVSGNTAVATIGATTGVVTGITSGNIAVSYLLSTGCDVSMALTVNPLPSAVSGFRNVFVGLSINLEDTSSTGIWSSSNSAIASIGSATGIVTGVDTGYAIITYSVISTGCITTYSVTASYLPAMAIALSPYSGIPGSTVTITGSGFDTNPYHNIVYFGATKATVLSASSTTLSVTVPSGATFQPVSVTNSLSGLTCYSQISFLPVYNNAPYIPNTVNFNNPVNFADAGWPQQILVADIDGDGKPDLVVNNDGYVSVFRNTATTGIIDSSSFAAELVLTVDSGADISSIAVGDLDGDGKQDIVASDVRNGKLICFHNTSITGYGISFAGRQTIADISTPYIALGDIDGDGKPDIAGTDVDNVSVFRNTSTIGSISFSSVVYFQCPNATYTTGIVLGDLDGDGKPEMAVSFEYGGISVYHNTSVSGIIDSSSFATAVNFTTPAQPIKMLIDDINGDGKADIVVQCFLTELYSNIGIIGVLTNNSSEGVINSSSFTNSTIDESGEASGLAMADINGDGKPDFGTPIEPEGESTFEGLEVLLNSSNFVNYSFFLGGNAVAMADLDGDNIPDLIAVGGDSEGNSVISIFKNNPMRAISGADTFCVGATSTLSDSTSGGTWSSGNTSVASAGSNTGIISGISGGTATVSYHLNWGTVTTMVTAIQSIITGNGAVCAGATTLLSDSYTGGSWSSSNTGIAIVGTSGLVAGISAGSVVITYILSGCATAKTLTVNALPAVISGDLSFFTGTSTTLSDLTTGGTWASGSTGIAAVGTGTGMVYGASAGTANITYTVNGCMATTTVTVNTPTSFVWYSYTGGGDAAILTNWWSNNDNSGYQPNSFATTNTTWIVQSPMGSSAALSFTGNLSITPGGNFTPLANSTTTVGGNWKNTNGAFSNNGGTVVFNGTNTTNTVDTLSGTLGGITGTNAFNNITFNGSGVSYTFLGNAADVSRNFTQTAGTVIAPSSNLNIGGNFDHTAGIFTPNGGTVTMNGNSSSITATGMVTATTNCFNNLLFNASSPATYTISSPLLLMGNFNNLTSLGTITVGNNNITVGGNWNNSGTITDGSSHILMNGSGVHTMTGNM